MELLKLAQKKNKFRRKFFKLNLQNYVYNIFQLHKTSLKINKKTKAYPGIEQLAYGTVAQGTRLKAPATRSTVPPR